MRDKAYLLLQWCLLKRRQAEQMSDNILLWAFRRFHEK